MDSVTDFGNRLGERAPGRAPGEARGGGACCGSPGWHLREATLGLTEQGNAADEQEDVENAAEPLRVDAVGKAVPKAQPHEAEDDAHENIQALLAGRREEVLLPFFMKAKPIKQAPRTII